MKKKMITILCAAMLGCALLAGCGSGGSAPAGTETETETETAAETESPVWRTAYIRLILTRTAVCST